MFAYLVRSARVNGKTYYIEGMDLLRLLQKRVNDAKTKGTLGSGDGTRQSPWRLRTPNDGLRRAVMLPKGVDNYLMVAGRLIFRGKDQYIEDAGPAWRAATPVADAMKAFAGVAPTYWPPREQWSIQAGSCRRPPSGAPAPDPRLPRHGARPASSRCSSRRSMLKGEKISLTDNGRCNRNYSRGQTALTVLVAAMFLAEPARNARAFPINLMLLDLVRFGVYTLDRVFWHPERSTRTRP